MSSAASCPVIGLNLLLSACPQTWFPTIPWASCWARRNESELLNRAYFKSREEHWVYNTYCMCAHTHTHTLCMFSWRQREDVGYQFASFPLCLVTYCKQRVRYKYDVLLVFEEWIWQISVRILLLVKCELVFPSNFSLICVKVLMQFKCKRPACILS